MGLIKSMPKVVGCNFEVQGSTVFVSYTFKSGEDIQRNVKISAPKELFEEEFEVNSRIA